MKHLRIVFLFCVVWACAWPKTAHGFDGPYLVTYTAQMEEPGDFDIENKSVVGKPGTNDAFIGSTLAIEYGLKGWWTTEVYFDGQATANQSTIFTGYRWENRFRLTREEHWINPVLYAEFEDLNGANKSLLEVVGHDSATDLTQPNAEARLEREHEAELKVILDSKLRGWNISENLIAEKNLGHAPWEFGYAAGVSRPLSLEAGPSVCNICRENFDVGVEFYGGLGDYNSFGLKDTSHYVAPLVAWAMPSGITLKLSPGFGVTDSSLPFLFRFGVSYEVPQIARAFRKR